MSQEPPFLLATRSAGKLKELRELLVPVGVQVVDLTEAGIAESAEEDRLEVFETFEENARAKARYFYGKSGLPTMADDSGLVIHALGGIPGVRSKRWSGRTDLSGRALDEANNAKLLAALSALPPDALPEAEYVCAAAFHNGVDDIVVRGSTRGYMQRTPHGTGGFGYDPYFYSYDLAKPFGEAAPDEKHAVSHRGRAFSALLERLGLAGPARR